MLLGEHVHLINQIDLIILETPAFNKPIKFIMLLLVIVTIFGFGFASVIIGRLRGVRSKNVGGERKRTLTHLFILILNHNEKIINFIRLLLIPINNINYYFTCILELAHAFVFLSPLSFYNYLRGRTFFFNVASETNWLLLFTLTQFLTQSRILKFLLEVKSIVSKW